MMPFPAPLAHAPIETHILVHTAFENTALILGAFLYRWQRKAAGREDAFTQKQLPILAGGMIGAGLGNKLAFWLDRPDLIAEHLKTLQDFLQGGQSILGGLVGGLIGIELGKRIAGEPRSTGDFFVLPILLGILIGRIGCFLAGLHDDTFGLPTALPWAFDFGDGIGRHPTQLYDMLFAALGLFLWHRYRAPLTARREGLGFKLMFCSYLLWRFVIDFLKPMPYAYFDSLSGLQLLCLITLALYLPLTLRQFRTSL